MFKLLVVFTAALVLAYFSEQNTKATVAAGYRYSVWNDWAYILLVVILTLFAGLRTQYNDTWNYLQYYKGAATLGEFLENTDNLNPFKNPLFYAFQSFLRSCNFDGQMMVLLASVITQACMIWFIKKYAKEFTFSIFLYFTLGTYVLTLAAIKQVLGMALAMLAFPHLERKQWGRYYFFVVLAMLIHTYALAFAVLPLFRVRPWSLLTIVFLAIIAIVMLNFEQTITAFMEQANDLGKTISEEEVFDGATINVFRLAIYAIPPLISFAFQKWVFTNASPRDNVLVHMCIISFGFMLMGTQAGANMFGRMANYFEMGVVCALPWMLKQVFDSRSYKLVSAMACTGFLGFFVYANAINAPFDWHYKAMTLWTFLQKIF